MIVAKMGLCVRIFSSIWAIIIAAVVEKVHIIVVFLVLRTPMVLVNTPVLMIPVLRMYAPRGAINLGCDPERNGWLVYIPQLNRISTMYHGSHQERKFMSWKDDSVTAPALPSGLHHPPRRVHTEDRDHEHGGVNQDHGGAEHQEQDDGVHAIGARSVSI